MRLVELTLNKSVMGLCGAGMVVKDFEFSKQGWQPTSGVLSGYRLS